MDNWDNRILWAVARRLKNVAAALDPQAARLVWKPFQHLLSWFGPVAEMPITAADFHKSRLGRTSRYYRRALVWARLLLQGSDLPAVGGQVPPLVLNAPPPSRSLLKWSPGQHFRMTLGTPIFSRIGRSSPDSRANPVSRTSSCRVLTDSCAVGDTKYKDVLERAAQARLGTAKKSLRSASNPPIGTNSTSTCE